METLKLEHLAGYLPYRLQVKSNKIETLIGLKNNNVIVEEFDIPYPIANCKPILYPLSCLTKEIEVNGEKFIPIIELLKIKHKGWYVEKQGSKYSEIDFELTNNYAKAWFKYHALHSIDIWLRDQDNESYWVIKKLEQWHIAIGIPEHLYIDKRTVK